MRWDSLVANGPAWHDRFPGLEFHDVDPDGFATKDQVAAYFEAYAEKIAAPIRTGRPRATANSDRGNGQPRSAQVSASSPPRRGDDQPDRRVALVASQLLGIVVARYLVALEPLASAPADELVATYAPTLQRYLTEPLP